MRGLFVVLALGFAGCANWSGEAPRPAPAQPPAPRFGAIAFSPTTGRNGASWGQPTQQAAEWAAVQNCAAPDCQPKLWVNQMCGAMAFGQTREVSTAGGKTREEAELGAMTACAQKQAGCRVVRWVCSR
jgi:hypothetical protein